MPTEQPTTTRQGHPADRSVSTVQPLDQRIAIIRSDLGSVFTELETIHDVIVTVRKGLLEQNVEQDGDFANVLQRCGSNKLFEQLLELTTIIEELGGTTTLTDEAMPDSDVAVILGTATTEGGDNE